MATQRQRVRKHARRVHHGLVARERRDRALATAPAIVSPSALAEHMEGEGYEQGEMGKWRRLLKPTTWRHDRKRGPVLKPKKKRGR